MRIVCRAVFMPDGRVVQLVRSDCIFSVLVTDRFDHIQLAEDYFTLAEANKRVGAVSERR